MSPWLAAAFAVALTLACSFQPALRLKTGRRLAVLLAIELAVLLTPMLVDPSRTFGRFLASVWAVALAAKLFDLHLGAILGDRPGFRSVATSFINLMSVVRRKLADEPRPSSLANFLQFDMMSFLAGLALSVFVYAQRFDWRPIPFAVEHSVKVLAFFLLLLPASAAGAALWRLLGGQTREPMDNPFAASTPGDFWRRYNRPAQQFFFEDVFKLLGGMRRPIFGTLVTFAISGLIHEYLFVITLWKLQGYQLAFFLIQGVAVVLTAGLRPKGWWRAVGIAATLAFNLATGGSTDA